MQLTLGGSCRDGLNASPRLSGASPLTTSSQGYGVKRGCSKDLAAARRGHVAVQRPRGLASTAVTGRAFPVIFASRVTATAAFYERLGFIRHFQLPAGGEPGYVGLRRGNADVAVVDATWPADQYDRAAGTGPRFEMFIYVDDVDRTVEQLRGQTTVLREPADMPWGERVAYITDPDDNPVALAAPASPAAG